MILPQRLHLGAASLLLAKLLKNLAQLCVHQLIGHFLELVKVSLLLITIYRLEALIAGIMEAAIGELLAQFVAKHLPVHNSDTLQLSNMLIAL